MPMSLFFIFKRHIIWIYETNSFLGWGISWVFNLLLAVLNHCSKGHFLSWEIKSPLRRKRLELPKPCHGRLWRSCLWVDMRDLTLASKKSLIKQLITRTCSCLEMWILLKAVIQLSVHLLTTMARSWMEWHEVDHILRIW